MANLDALNAALETQADMSKPETASGGGYTPPAAGIARARMVGYYEVGQHEEDEFNAQGQKTGKKRLKHKVHLVIELSGPKHEPREFEKDGVKTVTPHRITIKETYEPGKAPHIKSNFYKLFTKLNVATGGNAKHMAQLLDKPFLIKIFHKEVGSGETKRVYANAKGPDGYVILPTVGKNADDSDYSIAVAPALSPIKYFLFNLADKAMWDSIYIDGEIPARTDDDGKVIAPARSRNVIQNLIKSAANFASCPIATLVDTGKELDLGDAEKPTRSEAPAPSEPKQSAAPTEFDDDDIPF